jgi:Plasmid pRiA4b ORF-3-like protein
MTLGDLHLAIQATMGWEASHLHAFEIGDRQFGDRSVMDDVENENRRTLGDLVKSGMRRFRYTYDFGDDWQHDILIEKTPTASGMKNRGKSLPACNRR